MVAFTMNNYIMVSCCLLIRNGGLAMAKHLSLENRNLIAQRLNGGCSFKAIAKKLERNPTSISREIRNHLSFKKSGSPGRSFNACKHCNSVRNEFESEICQKLLLLLMSTTAVPNEVLPVLWKNSLCRSSYQNTNHSIP